jgi:hypothetical protein
MKNSDSTLMPWREQLALLVEVGADDLADLDAPLLVLGHVLGHFAGADDVAVAQLDDVAVRVDVSDEQTLVRLDAAGEVVQVHALAQPLDLPPDARAVCTSSSTRALGKSAPFADLESVDVQVCRAAGQVLDGDAAHGDLLHELLVVGVERVEPVHLGALDLVGRRVAQQQQRR